MHTKREITYPEVLATHFPDQTLNLLEARLCSNMALTEPKQHSSDKNKNNPRCGYIELLKPEKNTPFYRDKQFIHNQVKEFYSYRGFETEGTNVEEPLSVKNHEEAYSVGVFETDTTYIVSISEDLTSSS